jgi:hypothetical protein
MPRRVSPWAFGAFAIYLGGGLFFGERFPFSRFSMYADIAARDRGAIPVFLADGVDTEPRTFRSFSGLDPARFRAPEGVVSTLDYVVNERAAWVAAHPADTPGPIRIEVGFDLVRLDHGVIVHDVRVVEDGTAWR